MYIVTGASGFIGSCIVSHLNKAGIDNILAVDVLRENDKWMNLRHLKFNDYLDRSQLITALDKLPPIEAIIHIGACSATTERNSNYLMENNYRYTLNLARYAVENNIRFIYASSAATYGAGEQGYNDDLTHIHDLKPLNMYGYSKHLFDLKAYREGWLNKIVGLKFFNVYGPNEYQKGDMASVIFKSYNQIVEKGEVALFKSHKKGYEDGAQLRDFVYVKDVLNVIMFMLENREIGGLFNVGTGKARSFKDLVTATFNSMDKSTKIKYIDMPEAIRLKYQYFTEADMNKLKTVGFKKQMYTLEEGVADYVKNYLMKEFTAY